jgi:hypothetical protein
MDTTAFRRRFTLSFADITLLFVKGLSAKHLGGLNCQNIQDNNRQPWQQISTLTTAGGHFLKPVELLH